MYRTTLSRKTLIARLSLGEPIRLIADNKGRATLYVSDHSISGYDRAVLDSDRDFSLVRTEDGSYLAVPNKTSPTQFKTREEAIEAVHTWLYAGGPSTVAPLSPEEAVLYKEQYKRRIRLVDLQMEVCKLTDQEFQTLCRTVEQSRAERGMLSGA